MSITYNRYVIATKSRPTKFLIRGGELSDDFMDAYILENREEAEAEIQTCDTPKDFEIHEVVICVDTL